MEKQPIIAEAVYSRKEAAALLGVSRGTIKRMITNGALIASRPPGTRRLFIQGRHILAMLDQTQAPIKPVIVKEKSDVE